MPIIHSNYVNSFTISHVVFIMQKTCCLMHVNFMRKISNGTCIFEIMKSSLTGMDI